MILCFDAWIHQTSFWPHVLSDQYCKSAKLSIQKLMQKIKKWLPDPSRQQGWKNPKFHLLLHFVDMILRFGSPINYDSQHTEHNHKYTAKYPGRRAAKTHHESDFEKQSATRYAESLIINRLYDVLNDKANNDVITNIESTVQENIFQQDVITETTGQASQAQAFLSDEGLYDVQWYSKK